MYFGYTRVVIHDTLAMTTLINVVCEFYIMFYMVKPHEITQRTNLIINAV